MDDIQEEEKKYLTFTKRPSFGKAGQKVEITGPMKKRINGQGERELRLTMRERTEVINKERIETAVAMYLDVDAAHSTEAIAEAIGLSVRALKDLTKTEEFIAVWNENFLELGHDPRLKASQAALADMLPAAVKQLKELITGADIPASTRLLAIKELFRLVGVDTPKDKSDRGELAEFLKDHNIVLNQINVNPPTRPEAKGDIIDITLEAPSKP